MVSLKNMTYGTVVNIVYDSDILGQDSRCVVLATAGFEMAQGVEDVYGKHSNIYSSLKSKPENNPRLYDYLIFRDSTGKRRASAAAWISKIQIIKNLVVNAQFTVANVEELEALKLYFQAKGIADVEYTIQDNLTDGK